MPVNLKVISTSIFLILSFLENGSMETLLYKLQFYLDIY